MEPVTHMLTGACLSRSGLNRKAAYATLTMVVAAEFPDIDTLWSLCGPIEGFEHHRGITHTFLGLPFEAALIVSGVYLFHRWRSSRSRGTAAAKGSALTAAPVRWGVLYGLAVMALLSHLLLDYTNNYGLRPFFPFNANWYAASIVFIFDPLIFLFLLGALILPWLCGLIGAEVGSKKVPFRSRGWAICALLGVLCWWALREVQHGHAVTLAMEQSISPPPSSSPVTSEGDHVAAASADAVPAYLAARRVLASPDPLSPFHWSAATDFGPVYELSEIDTRNGSVVMGSTTYPKPDRSAAVLAAEESKLGRVYLDWSSMPIIDVTRPDTQDAAAVDDDPGATGLRLVTFRDPRFMGGWMRDSHRSALTGSVSLNASGRVVRETLDGRVEP